MATQLETATQIWTYLVIRGWTQESVAAVLGNMQSESGIIADRWESDNVGNMSGGYGLVQWTPATKYIDWAKQNGLVYQDVISQCKRIEWEVENNVQFAHPSMSFRAFTQSTQTPEVLADIFIRYYERPLNPNQPARQTQARYWYNKLKNQITTQKGETTMQCFFKPDGENTVYYFDGKGLTGIVNPDEKNILNTIYKENNGKDMPYISRSDAWFTRLKDVSKRTILK